MKSNQQLNLESNMAAARLAGKDPVDIAGYTYIKQPNGNFSVFSIFKNSEDFLLVMDALYVRDLSIVASNGQFFIWDEAGQSHLTEDTYSTKEKALADASLMLQKQTKYDL